MDIIIRLNLDPNSLCGLKIQYLTNCSNQLTYLYNIVPSTTYKDILNDVLIDMSNKILNDDIQGAENSFDSSLSNIQTQKDDYFLQYANYFKNQYNPPN